MPSLLRVTPSRRRATRTLDRSVGTTGGLDRLGRVTNNPGSATPSPTPDSTRDRIALSLDRLPRFVVPLVIVALVGVGIGIGGPLGGILAGLGILGLAGILALSWPRITRSERAMRLAVLVLLTGLTIVRTVPN